MSMSKQDFIALADTIRQYNAERNEGDLNSPPFNSSQIMALEWFCAAQNPRFNRARWLDYIAGKCGPNGGKL